MGHRVSSRALNSSVDGELALEPGLVGPEPGRRAERPPGLADQAGPQCQAARLVRGGPGDDGRHELVDPFGAQRRPGEADPEAHVLVERAAAPVEGAPQELAHPGVALDPAHLHGLLGPDLGLGGDVGDGGLHHGLLAERGEHLRDVAQEGAAGAEHEHAVPAECRMVVEEEGGPVEADRRLAGARAHPARSAAGRAGRG